MKGFPCDSRSPSRSQCRLPRWRTAAPAPRQWIDPATGHRVVRLSEEPGSTTLYFHDNAFSASGDKLMFRTPKGIAVIDVAKIGTESAPLDIVSATGRGGYFARRGRDIYLSAGAGNSGSGRGDGVGDGGQRRYPRRS